MPKSTLLINNQGIITALHQTFVEKLSTSLEPAKHSSFGLSIKGSLFTDDTPIVCEGRFDISSPLDGIMFTRGDVTVHGPCQEQLIAKDSLRIRLGISGQGTLICSQANELSQYSGYSCFIVDPGFDLPITLETYDVNHVCSTTLYLARGTMSQIWNINPNELPSLFYDFELNKNRRGKAVVIPLTATLTTIAMQILQTQLTGLSLDLFLQAKAREIISFLIHQLANDHKASSSHNPQLSERDVLMLEYAHQLIHDTFTSPLSINDLAHKVGLNRNKLCYGFKKIYGSAIFEYCRELRLQRGVQLLRQKHIPVSEIALEVGYEHPPAFSSAFKKRFGCSPKRFRDNDTVITQHHATD